MTANKAIGRLRVPLFVRRRPRRLRQSARVNQPLLRRARPAIVTVIKLPARAGHGWDMVTDPNIRQPSLTL
jgi:hypothetical protein